MKLIVNRNLIVYEEFLEKFHVSYSLDKKSPHYGIVGGMAETENIKVLSFNAIHSRTVLSSLNWR